MNADKASFGKYAAGQTSISIDAVAAIGEDPRYRFVSLEGASMARILP